MKRFRTITAMAAMLALAACQDTIVDNPQAATRPPEPESMQAQRGFILRDGVPVEVTFEVRGGRAIYEGDIDLGAPSEVARTREELLQRSGAAGEHGLRASIITSSTSTRWGSGYVPFVIESSVVNPQRIHDAMAHIESNTGGVDFIPRTTHTSWIIFRRETDPGACGSSPVGRIGGGQVVYISDTCDFGGIVHEIGHSLGMWHEQSRCDRDNYVQILSDNILDDREHNFKKICTGAQDYWVYDESSIMHYGTTAFGKPDGYGGYKTTIVSLRGRDGLIGQRGGLSTIDGYAVNHMYRPYPPTGVGVSYPGGVPSVSWDPKGRVQYYLVNHVVQHEVSDTNEGYSVTETSSEVGYTYTGTSLQDPYNTYTGQNSCFTYGSTWQAFDRHYYSVTAHYFNGETSYNGLIEADIAVC